MTVSLRYDPIQKLLSHSKHKITMRSQNLHQKDEFTMSKMGM